MTSYRRPRLFRREIRVEREAHPHRTILRVYGVLDATSALALRPSLETGRCKAREILLDLSHIEAIELSGVMTLTWLARRARACGAELRIVGVRDQRPAVAELLDSSGLVLDD